MNEVWESDDYTQWVERPDEADEIRLTPEQPILQRDYEALVYPVQALAEQLGMMIGDGQGAHLDEVQQLVGIAESADMEVWWHNNALWIVNRHDQDSFRDDIKSSFGVHPFEDDMNLFENVVRQIHQVQ